MTARPTVIYLSSLSMLISPDGHLVLSIPTVTFSLIEKKQTKKTHNYVGFTVLEVVVLVPV